MVRPFLRRMPARGHGLGLRPAFFYHRHEKFTFNLPVPAKKNGFYDSGRDPFQKIVSKRLRTPQLDSIELVLRFPLAQDDLFALR
jgi:hypothetical protein